MAVFGPAGAVAARQAQEVVEVVEVAQPQLQPLQVQGAVYYCKLAAVEAVAAVIRKVQAEQAGAGAVMAAAAGAVAETALEETATHLYKPAEMEVIAAEVVAAVITEHPEAPPEQLMQVLSAQFLVRNIAMVA